MTRIIHLTDLHFGATDPAVVASLQRHLNKSPPDLLAISGDLTQGARRAEFRAAMAFIRSIDAPALIVPGNHDITPYKLVERFLTPYQRWREEVGPETEPVWQNECIGVVGLNTARRGSLKLDWSTGRVTRSRLARTLEKLNELPKPLIRIVVAHHPLVPPEATPGAAVVGNASAALTAFAEHGVDLILAGHLHVSYARLARPQSPSPLILQGGSATSTRLRGEPNAYNRITINNHGETKIEGLVHTDSSWSVATTQEVQLTTN